MTRGVKKDNSTFIEKVAVRRTALELLARAGITQPVICETHGGNGALWAEVYAHLEQPGMVFETNPDKAGRLAKQRPTWAVYEADSTMALAGGVGALWTVDLLDVDPYGEPWPVIDAFFGSTRPFADFMVIAVNDGLRQKLAMGGAWSVRSMQPLVERYGNDLHPVYLELCAELLGEKVAQAGYTVDYFSGFYCGASDQMTQYLATLLYRRT